MDLFMRSSDGGDPPSTPLNALSTRQRAVVEAIERYEDTTGEPCPGRYLARRFSLNPATIRDHLSALHRKGWLRSANPPASLRRPLK